MTKEQLFTIEEIRSLETLGFAWVEKEREWYCDKKLPIAFYKSGDEYESRFTHWCDEGMQYKEECEHFDDVRDFVSNIT